MGICRRPNAFCGGLLLALLVGPPVWAEEIAPEKRAVILVRALSYDSNLKMRAGNDLVLAVLTRRPGDACATGMQRGFAVLGTPKVVGLPMRFTGLAYTAPEALAGAITQQGIDVLFLCDSLQPDLPAILEVARKHQVLTMGSSEEQVSRGTTLGVVFQEARLSLLVNLSAAKSVGAAFTSDLLRVARVIR
jgi:hypothetical protein